MLLLKALEDNLFLASGSFLYWGSINACVHVCFQISPLCKDTCHIGIAVHSNLYDPILITSATTQFPNKITHSVEVRTSIYELGERGTIQAITKVTKHFC